MTMRLVTLLCSFSLLPCFLFWTQTVLADAQRKIGVVLPLTGPLANVGSSLRRMVELADRQRDDGKIAEFVFEDDAFLAKNTVAAVTKLVEQDKVLGVIVFGSGTSAAVSLLLERKKIPAITIAMSEDVVRNREFIFRHYLPLSAQSNAIAAEVDRRNYHRIAVIATQQEAMLRFRDVFRQRFVNRIVLDEQVLPGEVDFSALVTRLRRANPEAVYLLLMPPELSVLPRRLREAKLEAEFFGSAQLQNPAVLAAANGALDGVWFTGVDDRRAQPLFREYQREFGELPVPDAVHAYEAALLFIAALRNVPDDVRSYLANPSGFRGALGEYGIVPPNTYEVGAVLKQITPQGFVYLRQAALE